jgi:hypothetical protein
MIQRIQTVLLLVATIFLSFVVAMPFAKLVRVSDSVIFELGFYGLTNESAQEVEFSSVPLSILIGLCQVITVITILLYKKRMLQIRASIINIILLVGLEGLMFYYLKAAQTELSANFTFSVVFVFPFVAAILVFLALRAIARDEALIRSLDRLR